jgi:hypothetical protein
LLLRCTAGFAHESEAGGDLRGARIMAHAADRKPVSPDVGSLKNEWNVFLGGVYSNTLNPDLEIAVVGDANLAGRAGRQGQNADAAFRR